MHQVSLFAQLEICEGCSLSDTHGAIVAKDGSHSCTIQSKYQAQLSLHFLEDHERITEDEFLLVKEQIDSSSLPPTAKTDPQFHQLLSGLRRTIILDEELLKKGQVPPHVRPWEIGFPRARSRDFLLAPKLQGDLTGELSSEGVPFLRLIPNEESPAPQRGDEETLAESAGSIPSLYLVSESTSVTGGTASEVAESPSLVFVTVSDTGLPPSLRERSLTNSPSPLAANDRVSEDSEEKKE